MILNYELTILIKIVLFFKISFRMIKFFAGFYKSIGDDGETRKKCLLMTFNKKIKQFTQS